MVGVGVGVGVGVRFRVGFRVEDGVRGRGRGRVRLGQSHNLLDQLAAVKHGDRVVLDLGLDCLAECWCVGVGASALVHWY